MTHHNEMCKCGIHVLAKAVLAFRQLEWFHLFSGCRPWVWTEDFVPLKCFHCHKLVPTLWSVRPLAHPLSGFDAYYANFFFPPEPTWNLSYFDVGLIVMAFFWTSTVQIEPKRSRLLSYHTDFISLLIFSDHARPESVLRNPGRFLRYCLFHSVYPPIRQLPGKPPRSHRILAMAVLHTLDCILF